MQLNNIPMHRKAQWSTKTQFLVDLKKYIQHKNVLSNNSDHYRKADVSRAIAVVNTAFIQVINNSAAYPLKKVYELVCLHKKSLRAILPNENNNSYANSYARIEGIISQAESNIIIPTA